MTTRKKDTWKRILEDVAKGELDDRDGMNYPRWGHVIWADAPQPWCHCPMCRARRYLKAKRQGGKK